MKKILSSVIILIMILCVATPCFAANTTLNNGNLTASCVVEAKYIHIYKESDGYTPIKGENGAFSGTTDSGLKIELEVPEEYKELTLVVHEITEQDKNAADWFRKQFSGAKNIAPIEIFFIDEDGNRHEIPAGTEVTMEGLKDGQYVVHLTSDGKKNRVPGAVKDGKLTFKMASNGYYVVVTPGEKPAPVVPQPDTGDDFTLYLWVSLMAISAAGVAILAKKRAKNEE